MQKATDQPVEGVSGSDRGMKVNNGCTCGKERRCRSTSRTVATETAESPMSASGIHHWAHRSCSGRSVQLTAHCTSASSHLLPLADVQLHLYPCIKVQITVYHCAVAGSLQAGWNSPLTWSDCSFIFSQLPQEMMTSHTRDFV